MTPSEWTEMGGSNEAFLTTHWSLIEGVKSREDRDRALIGLLLGKYWKPVYCYLRRKGYGNEEAKDLTQGFFHEIVLNKNLVQRADQAKGRFRSFLLHALDQYLINESEKQSARKRRPKGALVSLDAVEPAVASLGIAQLSPEDSYNYAWLSALLDEVLEEVRTACVQEGLDIHWKVFHERVVRPILEDVEPTSLAQLCEQYAIDEEKKASNMAITVKRRFQAALRKHVQRTVLTEDQVSEELVELMGFFDKPAQRPR
jgi:RNA polymerase sigma-70 factor (ECF subfamily)